MSTINDVLSGSFVPHTNQDWALILQATANLFKPKTPVDDDKLFAGRTKQISDILTAVYEDGGHAIIFGERGVGKTSLSKIVDKKVAPIMGDLTVVTTSCGKTDDFYTIWGNAFNQLKLNADNFVTRFKTGKNPYDVYNALQDLDKRQDFIFIFDEFDRLEDNISLDMMADLIKHFSNHPIRTTIIVVGVGDTLIDLFGTHESIARCCSQIRMPRMSAEELDEILDERLALINFQIEQAVKIKVRKLSQGLPGYVHLLGQLMLRNAIERHSTTLEETDFQTALSQALENADYYARQAYLSAIKSPRKDSFYREVLLACAMAETDEMGKFYAGDVRAPYSRIRDRPMEITNFATNLSNLCDEERGPALVRSGERKRYQYRFANPLVQPLAIMEGVKDGLIDFT